MLIPFGRVCEVMTNRPMIEVAFYDGIEVFSSFLELADWRQVLRRILKCVLNFRDLESFEGRL